MKRIKQVLLAAALLLCALPAVAQADGYRPMVRPGVKWVYFIWYFENTTTLKRAYVQITYHFEGETEIEGKTYMNCWRTINDPKGNFDSKPVVIAYAREEDKKVYAVYDEQYIASVNYYNAGYYEYRAEIPYLFIGGTCDPTTIVSGHYVLPVEEYLIYDFNDIPTFYARHPQITYDFGLSFRPIAAEEGAHDVLTYVLTASEASPVTIDGRQVNRYLFNIKEQASYQINIIKKSPSQPSPDGAAQVTGVYDRTPYILDGYGLVNRCTPSSSNCPAALLLRSFISPYAVIRNPKPYSEIFGNCFFGFCHIEEDGQIVYKSECCDITESHLPHGGDVPSGVSELPVGGGAAAGGRTYDLQGRAVNDPLSPGIYIRDGQKLLVE